MPILFKNKKAEELIAYLVCSKDMMMNKHIIASTLWPNSSNRNSLNSLYKVMEWIRTFPVQEIVSMIESTRGKISLNQNEIFCDLWEFNELYHTKTTQNWEHAVSLYQGMLYYEEGYSWAFRYDGEYDMKYFEMLEHLISHYQKIGKNRKATYYQKLLEVN